MERPAKDLPRSREDLEIKRRSRLLDLAMDGLTAEEANEILAKEGLTLEHIVLPEEVKGRESENRVLDYLKQQPTTARAEISEPYSDDDYLGRDIIVEPKMKLPLLKQYYVQVKSSQAGVDSFRAEIERRLWSRHLYLRKMAEYLAPEAMKRKLESEIDDEILKMRMIVIVAFDDAMIDITYKKGRDALYSYWQERSSKKAAKDRKH